MDISKIKLGMKVVINSALNGTVWTVIDKNGFSALIQENNYAPYWIDCSVLKEVK